MDNTITEVLREKCDYYKVITGSEVSDTITNPFESINEEQTYHSILKSDQIYIEEYEENEKLIYPEVISLERDEESIRKYLKVQDVAKRYLDIFPLDVWKMKNGKYDEESCCKKWLYIAKKYNLKIIVHVIFKEL